MPRPKSKKNKQNKKKLVLYLSLTLLIIIIFISIKTVLFPKNNVDTSTNSAKWNYDINKLPEVKMNVYIDSVSELPGARPDLKLTEERDFEIYLERPDIGTSGLSEKNFKQDDIYTIDLPAALRPKIIYLSDVDDQKRDSGNSCEAASFPHHCFINLTLAKEPLTQLVKVVFVDNTFAQAKITIPFPGSMDDPVLLAPQAGPAVNDNFKMKFKDVGADNYDVSVAVCHPYKNNGINPCLKYYSFNLTRQTGQIEINENSGSFTKSLAVNNIQNTDGTIEISSNSPLNIAPEDITVGYNIVAHKYGVIDGINTSIKSESGQKFQIKR